MPTRPTTANPRNPRRSASLSYPVRRMYHRQLLLVITWAFRYVRVALDTIVLYGVLGTRSIDERATSLRSGASVSEASSRRARSSGHAATTASNRSGGALRNTSGLSKRSSSSNPGLFSSETSKIRVRDRAESSPTTPPSHWG